MKTWVVKLGGSLYYSEDLAAWLNQLSQLSQQHKIVIVPGGGPFADQVRLSQQKWAYSDTTAHHMAILAMAQFGLLLANQLSHAELLYTPVPSTYSANLSVWIPDKQLLTEKEIEQNWGVTSDSLALWLAQHLKADELHIVKSVQSSETGINQLSEAGIIDHAFPKLYQATPIPTQLFYSTEHKDYPSSGLLLK